jgi:glucose-6-phosphate 1-dehydrogenase
VLDLWQKEPSTPLEFYPAGTAGPEAAEQLLLRDGRKWRPIA